MLMEMYAYPAVNPTLDGTGEICAPDQSGMGCLPCMMAGLRGDYKLQYDGYMRGLRGCGDPLRFDPIKVPGIAKTAYKAAVKAASGMGLVAKGVKLQLALIFQSAVKSLKAGFVPDFMKSSSVDDVDVFSNGSNADIARSTLRFCSQAVAYGRVDDIPSSTGVCDPVLPLGSDQTNLVALQASPLGRAVYAAIKQYLHYPLTPGSGTPVTINPTPTLSPAPTSWGQPPDQTGNWQAIVLDGAASWRNSNTGQIVSAGTSQPGAAGNRMSGYRMGDPFGLDIIPGIANSIIGFKQAQAAADLKKKELALQAQAQKAQQLEDAKNSALTQAQAAIAPEERQRNLTVYSLAAVGGLAALIGTAFLFSAMKSGKKK